MSKLLDAPDHETRTAAAAAKRDELVAAHATRTEARRLAQLGDDACLGEDLEQLEAQQREVTARRLSACIADLRRDLVALFAAWGPEHSRVAAEQIRSRHLEADRRCRLEVGVPLALHHVALGLADARGGTLPAYLNGACWCVLERALDAPLRWPAALADVAALVAEGHRRPMDPELVAELRVSASPSEATRVLEERRHPPRERVGVSNPVRSGGARVSAGGLRPWR